MKEPKVIDPQMANDTHKQVGLRLHLKYALLISVLVSTTLLASGLLELYFSYKENKNSLLHIQNQKAISAAAAINGFIERIEAQIEWTMHAAILAPDDTLAQRHIDFARLLRQVPEITEIVYVNDQGQERLLVSRIAVDAVESGRDYSNDPRFRMAVANGRHFSPVYFRRGSEPYLSLSLRDQGRENGVTIAEVNLKFVWQLISRLDADRIGSAFVVSSEGVLIAHRDISLVLRKTDLSSTPQVIGAHASSSDARNIPGGIVEGLDGREVLSSHAAISPMGWTVFVDSPLSKAFAPLYDSLIRSGFLFAAGVVVSVVAGALLARRIVKPIQALQRGASRIAEGELDHYIQVATGDELEVLANEFNEMSAKLRKSYENVERISALRRYFSPHLADLILSSDSDEFTKSHRCEITVIFCDLRNFTEFSTFAEPEEAIRILDRLYTTLGIRLREFEATIGHFAGDGLMAFLNDPMPCPDHVCNAVKMAYAMREDVDILLRRWQKQGLELGFGIGISTGYATLGHIGTGDQFHYTAIGSVVNLASRLCDEAGNGDILVSEPVFAKLEGIVEAAPGGEYKLKGFPKPVRALKLISLKKPNQSSQA
jgi:adenylate cyclase